MQPINYTTHTQANRVLNKLIDIGDEQFITILEDYEEKDHYWFPKTKNKLDRGMPEKIYTV